MYFLFLIYIASLAGAFFYGWSRYRDPFHPWVFLIPQLIFLYGVMPLAAYSNDPQTFLRYAGGETSLLAYQAVTALLTFGLLAGVSLGQRGLKPSQAWWRPQIVRGASQVRRLAIGLGVVAFGAWFYGVANAGGLLTAYGRAYGGGAVSSGYLVELPLIGLLGALLIYLLRAGKGMRPIDWILAGFCVFPVLFHGLLGARRGPMFMAAIVLVGGYFYFMRRRISLSLLLPGGILLGLLLLFLFTNRGDIYIGTGMNDDLRNPLDFLDQWDSNEYLIGSAVMRFTQQFGSFYGTRELTHLVGRLIPSALWPSIYTDMGEFFGQDLNFSLNAGIDPLAVRRVTGWQPSVGSAMGFVGDLWVEYQYLSPLVAALIGFAYGFVWRQARVRVYARFLYPVFAALSVYLIMQDEDAWLYRLLWLGVPIVLIASFNTSIRIISPPKRGRQGRAPHPLPPLDNAINT